MVLVQWVINLMKLAELMSFWESRVRRNKQIITLQLLLGNTTGSGTGYPTNTSLSHANNTNKSKPGYCGRQYLKLNYTFFPPRSVIEPDSLSTAHLRQWFGFTRVTPATRTHFLRDIYRGCLPFASQLLQINN